jgi:hypothetical protein
MVLINWDNVCYAGLCWTLMIPRCLTNGEWLFWLRRWWCVESRTSWWLAPSSLSIKDNDLWPTPYPDEKTRDPSILFMIWRIRWVIEFGRLMTRMTRLVILMKRFLQYCCQQCIGTVSSLDPSFFTSFVKENNYCAYQGVLNLSTWSCMRYMTFRLMLFLDSWSFCSRQKWGETSKSTSRPAIAVKSRSSIDRSP